MYVTTDFFGTYLDEQTFLLQNIFKYFRTIKAIAFFFGTNVDEQTFLAQIYLNVSEQSKL